MDTLAEDLEEVGEDKKLRGWVRRQRRQQGVEASEPTTWFAYTETPRGQYAGDRNLETLGRSPRDVLVTCELTAQLRYYHRRGVGRWLVESDGPESIWLVVEARHDPDAPRHGDG